MTEPRLTLSRFHPGTFLVVVPFRLLTWAFALTQSNFVVVVDEIVVVVTVVVVVVDLIFVAVVDLTENNSINIFFKKNSNIFPLSVSFSVKNDLRFCSNSKFHDYQVEHKFLEILLSHKQGHLGQFQLVYAWKGLKVCHGLLKLHRYPHGKYRFQESKNLITKTTHKYIQLLFTLIISTYIMCST